jgi:hypothetical protein
MFAVMTATLTALNTSIARAVLALTGLSNP